MNVAWFVPHAPAAAPDPLDDTASLVAELQATHDIQLYDARTAHDFVWQHARRPFDACVFELSDDPRSAYIWPYAVHYPGIVRLRSAAGSRRSRRALDLALGGSLLTVAGDRHAAATLADAFPGARIRHAPIGVAAPPGAAAAGGHAAREAVVFASADDRAGVVARAAARARESGSRLEVAIGPAAVSAAPDVVVALPWPAAPEPPVAALSAMAAGRATIVHEAGATAGWPALDPQTWQPRSVGDDTAPVAVSIDPRDEEHSLMLAMRRLAADEPLRRRLGDAGRRWWQENATLPHAAAAWRELLAEVPRLTPPQRPADWPPDFPPDGTERLRELLRPFNVTVDFLS